MRYPEQTDNYDIEVFNSNFAELVTSDATLARDLQNEANRAKVAEKSNSDSISAETERASAAEYQLAADIQSESDRAVSKETIIENNLAAESQSIRQLVDTAYANANGYTDTKIADLIDGAPSTLDTLGEIAQAMRDNESVVEALNEAIGKKASAAEFDSHIKNTSVHVTPSEKNGWTNKVDLSMLASYLSLAGGTMRGTIISTYLEPVTNRRYSIGGYSKRYSDIWAVSINTDSLRSPTDTNGLYLESSNGAIEICPDVSDYIRVIVENIDDGNGNINGALYAIGSRYPEYKETWLGTSDHPWDNIFASKINSRPVPTFSISGTTLYINF